MIGSSTMTAEPPVPPQGQVARDAYKRALRTYKQSLSAKEYAKVTVPATLDGTYSRAPDSDYLFRVFIVRIGIARVKIG